MLHLQDFFVVVQTILFLNCGFYLDFFFRHSNNVALQPFKAELEPQETQLLIRLIINGTSKWYVKTVSKEKLSSLAGLMIWQLCCTHVFTCWYLFILYTEKFFSSHRKRSSISKLWLYFTERITYAKHEMYLSLILFLYFQFQLESSVFLKHSGIKNTLKFWTQYSWEMYFDFILTTQIC